MVAAGPPLREYSSKQGGNSLQVSDKGGVPMQDMHDGMGAQLIIARRLGLCLEIERSELARVIDESLQDLRLIIDSLDVEQGDVLPLLGNLRFHLQPRLVAWGIAMRLQRSRLLHFRRWVLLTR